jgi:hypothetical protein
MKDDKIDTSRAAVEAVIERTEIAAQEYADALTRNRLGAAASLLRALLEEREAAEERCRVLEEKAWKYDELCK